MNPPGSRANGNAAESYPEALTSYHISALSACLDAIDGIFETFLSMDVARIRCLPVFSYVRVVYAVVVLIKLYFAASSQQSDLGKIIDKDHMKVEHYLHSLLDKFKETASEDRSRPAAKFLLVVVMLRNWLENRGKCQPMPRATIADPAATPLPGNKTCRAGQTQQLQEESQQQQQQPPRQEYPTTADTPLQLLSEVATGGAPNQARDSASYNSPAQQTSAMQPNWAPGQQQVFLEDSTSSAQVAQAKNPTSGPHGNTSRDYPSSNSSQANNPGAHASAMNSANNLLGSDSGSGAATGTDQQQHQQQQNFMMPWLNPDDFNPETEYTTILGGGFEQAMSLAGFTDSFMPSADMMGGAAGFTMSGGAGRGGGNGEGLNNWELGRLGFMGNMMDLGLGIPGGAAGGFY